ncbi:hypothetical protein [Candidatus Symbiobacter mobilis]|uniref:Transcriptional regulator n=1 Tax=Candidatus Symbiobacter mobilis CR TaxID=946483 RepID=U5N601_9BURK|nr:hypothetical protein [Candidatus Symbiobacter mobilis]AGX86710.1 hypothetical protein Cenrod_0599 [Candidatus Symbiobacter mobilis CR]
MTQTRDEPYDRTLLSLLTDRKEAAAYLDAVIEQEDSAAFQVALRHVANAQAQQGDLDAKD